MPCLDISTNVNLDGVDTDSVFSEATKAVASIMGKPENVRTDEERSGDVEAAVKVVSSRNNPIHVQYTGKKKLNHVTWESHPTYVMVLLKGPVPISFGGNKEPAAFAEVVSMGGINSEVKRKLIAAIGAILEEKLSIPRSRFFLKVHDTTAGRKTSKM